MGPRESLNQYIDALRNRPFQWGRNDCLTFTNGAFSAMYGKGWADDWLGRYVKNEIPIRRKEFEQEFGFKARELANQISKRLTKINYIPPLGALVTTKQTERWLTGFAMGISTGSKAVFLSKDGVIHIGIDAVDEAWVL